MREELLNRWRNLFGMIREAMEDGVEAVVMEDVGRQTAAALAIIRVERNFDDPDRRRMAAALSGFTRPPLTQAVILQEALAREGHRDRQAEPESFTRLYSQSVVEAIVHAAARWCRDVSLQPAGLSVLERVVEETMNGQYWDVADDALATIRFYGSDLADGLTATYARFLESAPPVHPSAIDFDAKRAFVEELRSNADAERRLVDMLRERDESARMVKLDDDAQAKVERLLEVARRFTEPRR